MCAIHSTVCIRSGIRTSKSTSQGQVGQGDKVILKHAAINGNHYERIGIRRHREGHSIKSDTRTQTNGCRTQRMSRKEEADNKPWALWVTEVNHSDSSSALILLFVFKLDNFW